MCVCQARGPSPLTSGVPGPLLPGPRGMRAVPMGRGRSSEPPAAPAPRPGRLPRPAQDLHQGAASVHCEAVSSQASGTLKPDGSSSVAMRCPGSGPACPPAPGTRRPLLPGRQAAPTFPRPLLPSLRCERGLPWRPAPEQPSEGEGASEPSALSLGGGRAWIAAPQDRRAGGHTSKGKLAWAWAGPRGGAPALGGRRGRLTVHRGDMPGSELRALGQSGREQRFGGEGVC